MSEIGRYALGLVRALGWRIGINRPLQIGSYVRYVGPAPVESIARRERKYLRVLVRVGGLHEIREEKYWHIPDLSSADPYSRVGSIGWKVWVV